MNALDIGIIIILVLIIAHGVYRGLIRQVFSLGALIMGIIVSGQLYPVIAKFVKPLTHEPLLADIIGWVAIFVAVVVSLILIGGMMHRAVAKTELSGANRMAGAIFAGVKGLVLILAGIGIVATLMTGQNPLMHRSFIAPRALRVLQKAAPIFPEEYRRALKDRLNSVHKEIQRSIRTHQPP